MTIRRLSLLSAVALFAAGCLWNESSEDASTESALASTDVDLRADTNRDGVISFTDPSDDLGEDVWDAQHGAIFLANIDDDTRRCAALTSSDAARAKCNDAEDNVVNGPDDALDLARLKTKPWPLAPTDATGTITFTAATSVRIFRVVGTTFTALPNGSSVSLTDLQTGLELAIEGRDIVRDPGVWDGFVDVTFSVTTAAKTMTDTVRMRVAPVITFHHGLEPVKTYVTALPGTENAATRSDLSAAATAAGVPAPTPLSTTDRWTQDFFETGYMSMPGPNGTQRVIRVNLRSANIRKPGSINPLREAGRVVFSMRGPDVAAIQQYDLARAGLNDTLNSFGNFETVPPYTYAGQSYPLGRMIRGSIPTYAPDKAFTRMMEAQRVQPPIYVDTSWLLVGHIDETVSFVKANTPRGWVALVNDATRARAMLEAQSNAGRGSALMHAGKTWSSGNSAQASIDDVLADPDVMAASADAAVEVDAQLAILKAATGLTDSEIVRIPFLHMTLNGLSIAYQPGIVNGLYLSGNHFVAPKPHGPVIAGEDIFEAEMRALLAPYGINVHFAEDWDAYHTNNGEVHCGTNSTREIPSAKWWESGR
jgi:protein-arginine deiminase